MEETLESALARQAEAGPSRTGSALCSAYPQLGSVCSWARPGVLYWNAQGQIVFHGSIQMTIATPYHPAPPYISTDSLLCRKPLARPRQLVISDSTLSVPPETDQAFPMHINRFVIDRIEAKVEDQLERADLYDDDAGTFYRPKSYHIKSIASSPNHASSSGSPYYAILDSSLTVTLYTFPRGSVQGIEKRLVNITGEQLRLQGPLPPPGNYAEASDELKADYQGRTAELRTNCIAWSPAPYFGPPIGAAPSASLLALGNRKGQIQLWSVGTDERVERIWTGNVGGKEWIADLCWSEWESFDAVTCQSRLAFVTPSGTVQLIRVSRRYTSENRFELQVGEAEMAIPLDKRAIKGIKWVHGVLVIVKVGIVQVRLTSGAIKTLLLRKLGKWTGCAGTAPCGGIGTLHNDAALISLWSGEVHIIRNLTTDPVIDQEASIASSRAVLESIQELDKQIVVSQREKQGGELRFTEHFTEDMTLRVVGADTKGTLLSIVFEPVALHKVAIIREGYIKHWVAVIDLVETLGEGLGFNKSARKPSSDETPATQALTYLPRWYHTQGNFELGEDTQVAESVEQTMDMTQTDLQGTLQYKLLRSPTAREEQSSTVRRLWQSAFRNDVTHATNAIAERTLSIKREVLAFLTESLGQRPGIVAMNAAFVRRWVSAVPKSHGFDEVMNKLGLWVPLNKGEEDVVQTPNECPICQEALTVHVEDDASGTGEEMRCELWHIWKRCGLTRRLITDGSVRTCYTCRKSVISPAKTDESQVRDDLEQAVLRAAVACPWCGSDWT